MTEHKIFKIKCVDGFVLEVRVGSAYYCEPKDKHGPWETVEVAVKPGSYDYFLDEHRSSETHTYSYYPYVPAQAVILCIDSHGGISEGIMPELKGVIL